MKNQNANYHDLHRLLNYCDLLLYLTATYFFPDLQPVLSSFPCTGRQRSQQAVKKKEKKEKKKKPGGKKTLHSASVFETLESFETEHFFLA